METINWLRHGGVSTNVLAGCCSTLQLPAMGMSVRLVGWVEGGREEVGQVNPGTRDGHADKHCTGSCPRI